MILALLSLFGIAVPVFILTAVVLSYLDVSSVVKTAAATTMALNTGIIFWVVMDRWRN